MKLQELTTNTEIPVNVRRESWPKGRHLQIGRYAKYICVKGKKWRKINCLSWRDQSATDWVECNYVNHYHASMHTDGSVGIQNWRIVEGSCDDICLTPKEAIKREYDRVCEEKHKAINRAAICDGIMLDLKKAELRYECLKDELDIAKPFSLYPNWYDEPATEATK